VGAAQNMDIADSSFMEDVVVNQSHKSSHSFALKVWPVVTSLGLHCNVVIGRPIVSLGGQCRDGGGHIGVRVVADGGQ
jgi:hypothetical protein